MSLPFVCPSLILITLENETHLDTVLGLMPMPNAWYACLAVQRVPESPSFMVRAPFTIFSKSSTVRAALRVLQRSRRFSMGTIAWYASTSQQDENSADGNVFMLGSDKKSAYKE